MIEPAPRQCFRCWEYGHIKVQCRNTRDRTGKCYKCGEERHRAAECEGAPKCKICKDNGRPYNHRMGNRECSVRNGYRNG